MGNHNNEKPEKNKNNLENKSSKNSDKNGEDININQDNINNNQIINENLNENSNLFYEDNERKKIFVINKINKIKKTNKFYPLFRRDNMRAKIKRLFSRFLRDLIVKNLIKEINIKFFRRWLPELRKSEIFWKMKISDIIYEEKNSRYHFGGFKAYDNRKVIDNIYKEKEEIKVIKILELTFEELFIIFRRKLNDPEDVKRLEEMKDKIDGLDLLETNDKYQDFQYYLEHCNLYKSQYYIENLKTVCLDFESFFKVKQRK